jgi:hypothetical protein
MHHEKSLRTAAGINAVVGLWLFASPWIYSVHPLTNSWNDWIVGAIIVLFSGILFSHPVSARGLSFLNMLLGAWVFASPWIFNYTHSVGWFANSLCVGAIVFILSTYGSMSMGHPTTGAGAPPPLHP